MSGAPPRKEGRRAAAWPGLTIPREEDGAGLIGGAPVSPATTATMAFAGLELRYPRALDPHPNWTLGDALTDATRRSAPPTPLKQPPEWASGGDMREKAFVMRVEEEDGSEEEDDNTDEDAHALVTTGARFPCNDLECSGFEDSGDEVDCSREIGRAHV